MIKKYLDFKYPDAHLRVSKFGGVMYSDKSNQVIFGTRDIQMVDFRVNNILINEVCKIFTCDSEFSEKVVLEWIHSRSRYQTITNSTSEEMWMNCWFPTIHSTLKTDTDILS